MLNFSNKGQAAMDLLLTYGWVLVVIVGIIAVLASSDVFNFEGLAGDKCIISGSGLTCAASEVALESGSTASLQLSLTNSNPKSVTVTGVNLQYDGGTAEDCDHVVAPTVSSIGTGTGNLDIASGESKGVKFTGCTLTSGTHVKNAERETYNISISVNFNSGVTGKASGTVTATATAP